jgi:hypothetical protein
VTYAVALVTGWRGAEGMLGSSNLVGNSSLPNGCGNAAGSCLDLPDSSSLLLTRSASWLMGFGRLVTEGLAIIALAAS